VSLARRADRGCLYVYAARNVWWGSRQGSFCHPLAALAPASSSCIQSGCCCSASFIITLRAACRVAGAVSSLRYRFANRIPYCYHPWLHSTAFVLSVLNLSVSTDLGIHLTMDRLYIAYPISCMDARAAECLVCSNRKVAMHEGQSCQCIA
jgi:hypothetical protein